MIVFQLETRFGPVRLRLDADQPHQRAPIQLDGSAHGVQLIQRWLASVTGAFGHTFGEYVSPVDLHAATTTETGQWFRPKILRGRDLVTSYDDPGAPQDNRS